MGQTMRLDQFVAKAAGQSRGQVKQLLRQGRVTVDGEIERRGERKVDPAAAEIALDGAVLRCQEGHRWLMLNKPLGVITATEDRSQKTVLDLLGAEGRGLFPVGRLDKDTAGLLLLTDDGETAHRLTSPRHHVEKVYLARTEGVVTPEDAAAFAAGITLRDGTLCRPARLEALEDGLCRVTLAEGKYHQVRRMLAARGKPVVELTRCAMGPLRLDPALAPGAYRPLRPEEVEALQEACR